MSLKKIVYFVFAGGVAIILFSSNRNEKQRALDLVKQPTKYILFWTPLGSQKDYYVGFGYEPFKSCKYKNCYSTDNKTMLPLQKFDVLIFHACKLNPELRLPWIRSPHQRYVVTSTEAPVHACGKLKVWDSYFNWTMSYRYDSDFVRRHGTILERDNQYNPLSEESFKKKTKLAAWFVSHCKTDSKRELLAKHLQKYMQVDIYGKCGRFSCGRQGKISKDACYQMLEQDYKFYFSFENSYCKDYVTEKLYYILPRDIVPVVYGSGNYTVIAPPNSVINVEDFDSVKKLARYLKKVAGDYKTYLKYFEWKKNYTVHKGSNFGAFCEMCKKLNEPLTTSIYRNLYGWWWGENKHICRKWKRLPKIVADLL